MSSEFGAQHVASVGDALHQHTSPFYFEDSQVVLQIEEQKYKVHRYFLIRESVFFNDMFSLPQSGDPATVEGSDDNPVKLANTPTVEFESLLQFIYFGMHADYAPRVEDWIAILSISTRLIFEKIRDRAIKELTRRLYDVEPFDLIGLASKYEVEKWFKPAYHRIVSRSKLITHADALKVPFPMAVMLMRSRETYWSTNSDTRRSSLDAIINKEIEFMESATKESPKGAT
ncbi:hypothetical protein BJV74DRAFT_833568 [Russula compacta]|nr:hypothetical protein BJV74DRAFT_833568 [Russula compacta]